MAKLTAPAYILAVPVYQNGQWVGDLTYPCKSLKEAKERRKDLKEKYGVNSKTYKKSWIYKKM